MIGYIFAIAAVIDAAAGGLFVGHKLGKAGAASIKDDVAAIKKAVDRALTIPSASASAIPSAVAGALGEVKKAADRALTLPGSSEPVAAPVVPVALALQTQALATQAAQVTVPSPTSGITLK